MKHFNTLPDKACRFMAEPYDAVDIFAYSDYSNPCDRPLPVILPVPKQLSGVCTFTLYLQNRQVCAMQVLHQAEIYNLLVNTVYSYTFTTLAKTVSGSFIIDSPVRMLYVDGIRNVRDIGNRRTNAGVIKQGLLYRGSEMNLIDDHALQLTPAGYSVMQSTLQIKTDIDLRNYEETGKLSSSPLGEGVKYINCPVLGYANMLKPEYYGSLRSIIAVLADKSNYPVYIHCWAGADRTGTFIALLQAALGVCMQQLTREFEISNLSVFGPRGRANREFTYTEVFDYINTLPGKTLQQKAEYYFVRQVGVTQQQLDSIASILISAR